MHVNNHYTSKRAVPMYGRVASLALTETALSFLDAVLTVFLLSCLLLIARKMHLFLLSGQFSPFSIITYSN